jgi:hypothetical protein
MNHLGAQRPGNTSPDQVHRCTVHQRPQRKHEASVFAGISSQALRQAQTHKIEGRPGLVEGWRLRESIEENFVGVAMLEGKLQIALASLGQRSGAAQRCEEFSAGPHAHGSKNIVAVVVTLVEGWSSGAGCLGHAAHGESFFAASGPQPAGGVKDALLELRICLSGQRPASVPSELVHGPIALTMSN